MPDTLIKEPGMIVEPTQDSELIKEIQRYLGEFHHDLLDGGLVRDALLDLMNLAKGN